MRLSKFYEHGFSNRFRSKKSFVVFNLLFLKRSPVKILLCAFVVVNFLHAQNGQAGSKPPIITGFPPSFSNLSGITVDSVGNIYVIDTNLIKKITPNGIVSTLAGSNEIGSANGIGKDASFNYPTGITVDNSGNLYIADTLNQMIRKITPGGLVTTLAGSGVAGSGNGSGNESSFFYPMGIAVDKGGNVYVADTWNNLVRKITPEGKVKTLAGPDHYDSGFYMPLNQPVGIAVDSLGNIFVVDKSPAFVWEITANKTVTIFAGDAGLYNPYGKSNTTGFYNPMGVAVDTSGNVYVAETGRDQIWKITPEKKVEQLAGQGFGFNGPGNQASFDKPWGIVADLTGHVFVSDTGNNLIRKISNDGVVTTFSGDCDRKNNHKDGWFPYIYTTVDTDKFHIDEKLVNESNNFLESLFGKEWVKCYSLIKIQKQKFTNSDGWNHSYSVFVSYKFSGPANLSRDGLSSPQFRFYFCCRTEDNRGSLILIGATNLVHPYDVAKLTSAREATKIAGEKGYDVRFSNLELINSNKYNYQTLGPGYSAPITGKLANQMFLEVNADDPLLKFKTRVIPIIPDNVVHRGAK